MHFSQKNCIFGDFGPLLGEEVGEWCN